MELAASLEREGFRPKPRKLASGAVVAAERFRVGTPGASVEEPLHVGEVAYRGEISKGEHEPIVDRELFEEVQARLAEEDGRTETGPVRLGLREAVSDQMP